MGLGNRVRRASKVGLQIGQLHLHAEHVVFRSQSGPVHRLRLLQGLAYPADGVLDQPVLLLGQEKAVEAKADPGHQGLSATPENLLLERAVAARGADAQKGLGLEERLLEADGGGPGVVRPELHGQQVIFPRPGIEEPGGDEVDHGGDVAGVASGEVHPGVDAAPRLRHLLLRHLKGVTGTVDVPAPLHRERHRPPQGEELWRLRKSIDLLCCHGSPRTESQILSR